MNTSISPVACLALIVSGVRFLTSPSTRITHSERTVSASLNAAESGSITSCVMP